MLGWGGRRLSQDYEGLIRTSEASVLSSLN